MEVDRLSHHPCHRLSVPAAKLFWCRHCMEKFEDPISRWRHSKTCKTEGTLNMNKRKEQEAEAFKLFVESTTEPEQDTEMASSPQLMATVSPPEKVPSVTQQTGTDLSCIICKKEFTSLDEMRAHVRTPCNKQDKHLDGYNRFPFNTDSFRNINMESANRVHMQNEFDSLFSLHNNEKAQIKEEVLIAKLLSQWSQQKVSCKQPSKETKYKPPLLKTFTATSLDQNLKHMQSQSPVVLDTVKGRGFSLGHAFETCNQSGYMSTKCVEIGKDFAQQDNSYHNHKPPEEALKNETKESQCVNSVAGKVIGVMQQNVQDALDVRKDKDRDKTSPMSVDKDNTISVDADNFSCGLSPVNANDVSKSYTDQMFEQSDKENQVDASSHVSKENYYSLSLKCAHPVTVVSDVVSSLHCDNTQHQYITGELNSEKTFTVLKDPETLYTDAKGQENEISVTKTCSSRKYPSVKVSKNKPKPVRAVVPIVNTGARNTDQDDSDDSTESMSRYRTYPPSPATTRSKHKDPPFCSVRSTARTLKPTQKKIELMIKQKSKSKVQIREKKQDVIKEQIVNKKPVKKPIKGSGKQTVKKQSIGKESKLKNKKKKPENSVMFHQLKNEKSRSKPPKNLKCRLCDRIFDSVKQYQNHTRIPCKMKITRKWSQKVLRPNRSLPPKWKPKPGRRKNKEVKKPNLIPNNFRINSQWEPNKRIRKITKTKNRPASPQLSIVESSKEKRPLPHQQVEVSDLTEKELFLFHLGLMCSDDLPLTMCIRPSEQYIPLVVSIDSAISDNLSDCYISPPVLERIDIDEHVAGSSVASADVSSNLEPPHLVPAVLCNDSLQTHRLHSQSNLLSGPHDVARNSVEADTKSNYQRNIFDVISVVKQSESDISDYGSASPVQNDKEIAVEYSWCKVLYSPSNSHKPPKVSYSDTNGSNNLLKTKPPLCLNTKSAGDLVMSPRRKEKRNLFESLGWEMLSENSDLSLLETKAPSPLQGLAQRDGNMVELLSKGLGIQAADDAIASPVKNSKQYLHSSNSPCRQAKFEIQKSVLEPLKAKLLNHLSPASPNSSNHRSPVIVPTPRRPSITKPKCSSTHLHGLPVGCIPEDVSGVTVKHPVTVPSKDTGKCNQELMFYGNISKSTVTSINYIARKLQFNSSYEHTSTGNESSTDMSSREAFSTQRVESPCSVLQFNSHVRRDWDQNVVQIQVLHRDDCESSDIEDLLADMVHTVCSEPSRGQPGVCVVEPQCECQNTLCLTLGHCCCQSAVISGENLKDTNLHSCAQNKCLSNKSTSVSTAESFSGSSDSSVEMDQTDEDVCQMYRDEAEDGNGDFDEVDGDTDVVCGFELEGPVSSMDTGQEECSQLTADCFGSDVTVEYVDHITSEMLDDTDDVTYIIIEQSDDCDYTESVKDVANTDDSLVVNSFVSVS